MECLYNNSPIIILCAYSYVRTNECLYSEDILKWFSNIENEIRCRQKFASHSHILDDCRSCSSKSTGCPHLFWLHTNFGRLEDMCFQNIPWSSKNESKCSKLIIHFMNTEEKYRNTKLSIYHYNRVHTYIYTCTCMYAWVVIWRKKQINIIIRISKAFYFFLKTFDLSYV